MKTTVSSKGPDRLTSGRVPRTHGPGWEPGQEFDVERLDHGDYRLIRREGRHNAGVIDWLLACPQKDFFVPIDCESADSL